MSDTTPQRGDLVRANLASIADADGLLGATFSIRWQQGDGTDFTNIAGATGRTFTPGAAQVGDLLRVVVSYTDDEGTQERLRSAASAAVSGVVLPAVTGLEVSSPETTSTRFPVTVSARVPGGAPVFQVRVSKFRSGAPNQHIATVHHSTPTGGEYRFRLREPELRRLSAGKYRVAVRVGATPETLGPGVLESLRIKPR
jgi:hypothetical protein